MTTTPHLDVVVVGAGLAGLAAASTLSGAGLSVRCLEARHRVGGRAASVEVPGGAVDLGASWIWPGEQAVHGVIEQLGVRLHDQSTSGDAMFDRGEGPEQLTGNPIDVPSSRFSEGAQNLAVRLAALLEPGTVRLGEPVRSLSTGPAGVRVQAAGASYDAAHVLLALPPALAVDSIDFVPDLPADVRRAAAQTSVWMGQSVKAVAVYDEAFWRHEDRSGSAVSHRGPFVEFHDHSGPDHRPAALFAFAPADRFVGLALDEIAERFREQLGHLFGERAAEPAMVHVCDWSRERYTTPAHPAAAPAQAFGHPVLQHATLGGRVSWASTETSTAYAGHLEGAVRAGLRAARGILDARRDTGVPGA